MIEEIGNASDTTKRASVLSVEAQLASILLVIFAPIIGFLADQSYQLMFFVVSGMMLAIFLFNAVYNFRSMRSDS
jgi:hypothetical protein